MRTRTALTTLPLDVCKKICFPSQADDGRVAAALRCTCMLMSRAVEANVGLPAGRVHSSTGCFVFPPESPYALGELVAAILLEKKAEGLRLTGESGECILSVGKDVHPFIGSISVEKAAIGSPISRLYAKVRILVDKAPGRSMEGAMTQATRRDVFLLPSVALGTPEYAIALLGITGGGSSAAATEWTVRAIVGESSEGRFLLPAPSYLNDEDQIEFLEKATACLEDLFLRVDTVSINRWEDVEKLADPILGAPGRAKSYAVEKIWLEAPLEIRAPNGHTREVVSLSSHPRLLHP